MQHDFNLQPRGDEMLGNDDGSARDDKNLEPFNVAVNKNILES